MPHMHNQFSRSVQDLIVRKIHYEHTKHRIVRQYIEKRRRDLEQHGKSRHESLESAADFARQRAEFWLTVVQREIESDLDDVLSDFKKSITNDILETVESEFPEHVKASKNYRSESPFEDSPDFLKTFDIFKAMNESIDDGFQSDN